MTPRSMSRADKRVRAVMLSAFVGFVVSGGFYIFQPQNSSSHYYDSSLPAILWGVVFFIGGAIAVWAIIKRIPHLERLGLMLVIIAGAILTISQAALMFELPITWTRGGGTGAYGSFTLLAFAFWLRLRKQVEAVNLVADIESEREGDDGP